MNQKSLPIYYLKLLSTIFILLTTCFPGLSQVSPESHTPPQERVRFIPRPLSNQEGTTGSDRGAPGDTVEGSSRPTGTLCSVVDKDLTPLMPRTQTAAPQLTVNEYPTFWFYIPYGTPITTEFMLLDEQEKVVYEKTFTLSEKPGIVSIEIPKNSSVQPLETGKKYQWIFSIICDPESPSANLFNIGTIQRVDPQAFLPAPVNEQLKTATDREQVLLYAAQGIWYDALTILAENLINNPSDLALKTDWNDLLNSVGLGNIINEPIVQQQ